MTWFKVDDNLPHHHKVVAAGNAAMGLWVRAGALCAQQLTDGQISRQMLRTIGTDAQARRLVAAGLWRETNAGYEFHEWSERQPTKEEVKAERAKAAERQRNWRNRNGTRNGVTNTSRNGVTNASPARAVSRPDPTRPLLIAPSPDDAPPSPGTGRREELSNNARTAQHLLGCPDDDPRLDRIDELITTHQPRNPRAWLKAVTANGDLDDLITAADHAADNDPWAHVPHDTGGEA